MPSQFHFRDILIHVIVGSVLLILGLLFCWLCLPDQWKLLAAYWLEIRKAVDAILLLPLALIVVYVVGSTVSARGLLWDEPTRGRLTRWANLWLIWSRIARPDGEDYASRKNDELDRIFLESARRALALPLVSERDLFRLAKAHLLSQPQTLQQLDIERHFALRVFNARLCMLFSASTVLAFAALVVSLLQECLFRLEGSPACDGTRFLQSALLCGAFYLAARSNGRKAQSNHAHYEALVREMFVAQCRLFSLPAQRSTTAEGVSQIEPGS